MLLLGSGEIGREVAIEAIRLGAEVVAVDRYQNAPAMQVAHRSHVIAMTDGRALRAVVEAERPDVIVPEIEQIDTGELVRLEAEGWIVVPNAEATRATMDRERIRRLAAEGAKVPTSRFAFANSVAEAERVAKQLGFPCLFKSITSSSGHGMSRVDNPSAVAEAYRAAAEGGRVANPRIMAEELVRFELEVTVLTLRHYNRAGQVVTTTMAPIGHSRPGTLYHESWQPAALPPSTVAALDRTAAAVTGQLGGVGMFGVECFVRGDEVLFSEVSPRPHDTGLVTLASQWNTEFALHARAILGFPYEGPEPVVPSAAHVILSPTDGWAPTFGGLFEAFETPRVRLFLFGKPEGFPDRRLGVAVAQADSVASARRLAAAAAHRVETELGFEHVRKAEPAAPASGR
ncbi:MAG: formate-dependent phosphoribosylglycinamide formyltransferase [Candidatus Lutacidiplasmatales archaeon]